MDVRGLGDKDEGPTLGESRARVLEVLRSAPSAAGARDLADRTGLHPNTVRFHLDALVKAGLAEREPEARDEPGRPRIVYRATTAGTGRRSYRLLAEILASVAGGMLPDPPATAAEAGRAWGAYLTDRPPPFHRIDAAEALGRLIDILAELGFDPDTVHIPDAGVHIRLRHCPFREVAENHRDVVCSLHLGLMQGAMTELRAPLAVTELEPFVEPNLCLAHVDAGSNTTRSGVG